TTSTGINSPGWCGAAAPRSSPCASSADAGREDPGDDRTRELARPCRLPRHRSGAVLSGRHGGARAAPDRRGETDLRGPPGANPVPGLGAGSRDHRWRVGRHHRGRAPRHPEPAWNNVNGQDGAGGASEGRKLLIKLTAGLSETLHRLLNETTAGEG